MNFDNKTIKTIRIMFTGICVLLLLITLAIANFWISKQKVYKARGYIPEGVEITKDNFDELFFVDEIPLKDYDSKYYYLANKTEEAKAEMMGKKIKYSRIYKDRIGPDVVNMTEKDSVAFLLYHWGTKLNTRMVGKYIKIPQQDGIFTKGIRRGIDSVKIKFGRIIKMQNGTNRLAIAERFIEAPVMDFDNSNGTQVKGILVGIPEKISLELDEELRNSKYVIVDYMPWRSKDIKEEPYKKIVFSDEIDNEYLQGINYNIGDKSAIDVSKMSTKVIQAETTTPAPIITK